MYDEFFYKSSERLKAVNCFCKKAHPVGLIIDVWQVPKYISAKINLPLGAISRVVIIQLNIVSFNKGRVKTRKDLGDLIYWWDLDWMRDLTWKDIQPAFFNKNKLYVVLVVLTFFLYCVHFLWLIAARKKKIILLKNKSF